MKDTSSIDETTTNIYGKTQEKTPTTAGAFVDSKILWSSTREIPDCRQAGCSLIFPSLL